MKLRYLIIFYFSTLAWGVVSPAHALRVESFTLAEGLPDNTIRAIAQDQQGFLWFGTHAGLVRFDGYEMKVFLPVLDDSTSIGGRLVNRIMVGQQGNIWVGTLENGVSCYQVDTGRFRNWPAAGPGALPGRTVGDMAQEADGSVLVGFLDSPYLARIDPASGRTETIAPPPSMNLVATDGLLVDERGWIWTGSTGQPILARNGEGEVVRTFDGAVPSTSQPLMSGQVDAQGRLWFISDTYLYQFDPETDRFRYWAPPDAQVGARRLLFTGMAVGSGEKVWVSASIGLFQFLPSEERFEYWDNETDGPGGLPDAPLFSVLEDRSGILWIGTWHGGLVKHTPPHTRDFRVFSSRRDDGTPSLPTDHVSAVSTDNRGQLWVGLGSLSATGPRGGLCYLDRQQEVFRRVVFPDSLVRAVTCLVPMGRDSLWVGTERGLWLCDTARRSLAHPVLPGEHADLLNRNIVRSLEADSHGGLWVCSQGRGIFHLAPDRSRITAYRHDPNDDRTISQNTVPVILEDGEGSLWFGTDMRGLNRLDPASGTFTRYFDPKLGLVNVTDMIADPRGHLWLATIAGLLEFSPESGRVINTVGRDQGLPNDFVGSVLRDRQGHLWLSTGWGLVDYDPEYGGVRTFGLEDNLPSDEIHFGHHQARDGTLYFGGKEGLVSFHPNLIRKRWTFEPPVVLTEVRLFDTPLEVGGTSPLRRNVTVAQQLELPWNQNHLTFGFAALDFSRPDRIQYRFRLEGHDSQWRRPGSDRQAVYTSLPPGRYVFRAQATGSEGVWSPHEAHLEIQIHPPWWRTLWAYLIYGLAVIGILAAGYILAVGRVQRRADLRVRMLELRKLREMDKTKSRFFANISHEFRTPLTLIQGPLGRLQQEPGSGDAGVFSMMHRNALRLGQLIDQLLDLSRLESRRFPLNWQPLDALGQITVLVAGFRTLAHERGLEFRTDIPAGQLPCLADPDLLEKVTGNLLANAIKYTPLGGRIWVEVELGPEQEIAPAEGRVVPAKATRRRDMTLRVGNTGPVIPPEEQERIFERFYQMDGSLQSSRSGSGIGLALARELATLLGGEISLVSREETGTVFTVRLPLYPTSIPIPLDTPQALEKDAGLLNLTAAEPDPGQEEDGEETHPLLLVVEDDADLRAFLFRTLKHDYRVVLAASGEEGLEAAFTEVPDLVVSDVMMPGIDGLELCAALKKDQRTSHIPVILLTARTETDSRLTGLRSGADAYLGKPFEPEELLVRIRNLISQRQLLRQRFAASVREGVTIDFDAGAGIASADREFLERVAAIARDGIEDAEFSVARFSREVGMSRSQLHRKLTALTGLSASAFLRSIRLQRAAELLAAGYGNVTEVAYATGHKSLSPFSRNFREMYGVPPSEYSGESGKS